MPGRSINNLVFLDENGINININMTRRYGRPKTSERAVDSAPLNMPCSTAVLSSIRLDGRTARTVYKGWTTAGRFAEYLGNILIPTLSKDDIIVMDNVRSHHAKAVKEVLDASGIKYLYLPPYSPDLNPIEKMWSKIKAYLGKEKVRMMSRLPDAVEKAFSTITASDCIGWFCSHNYVQ